MKIKKFINVKNPKDIVEFNFTIGEFSWEKKQRPGSYQEYKSEDGEKMSIFWGDDGYSPVAYWD